MPRAAFLHLGSFSHINRTLLDRLRTEFADHDLEPLDLRPSTTTPKALARTGPVALAEHGARLRSKADLRIALETNSAMFAMLSRRAARYVRDGGFAFSIQTQSLFNAAATGTPHFVYTDHTALANRHYAHVGAEPRFPHRWLRLERGIYRDACITFATGTNVMDSLREDYAVPATAARLALTGINLSAPADVSNKSYAARELVFVGVAWERKGGPELIAALDRLIGRFPDLRLTVVGTSPPVQRPYLRAVKHVPPDQLVEFLGAATIFVLPARLEPAGIAYSEAAAFGLPVIATRTGGIPDRVHDGATGMLVAPGDDAALEHALGRLLKSEELRRTLGQAGRALALPRFTWESVARTIAGDVRAAIG